ncbi:PREDICTED: uncharacterized protein LOC109350963 [Lupinus angustifolius]|uniref:uncharacterized protein LOC109350963 n=1 Tax=Lupinus angustifolius TaxID=3871 RepID=UPI00092EC98B|nr:PREDICTED: uncharacterized protein LOC109350963 [Lupinus angustifolius]
MAIAENEIPLKAIIYDKHSLSYKENLTLPPFQVIVMTANMECNRCRKRVFKVVSKMTGLTEYTLDVSKKQVTIKGDFKVHCKLENEGFRNSTLKSDIHPPKCMFTCLIPLTNI